MAPDWQQHYPTYTYVERDVLLAEYQASAAQAAAEEKLFLTSGNIAFVVAAGLSSLVLGRLNELYAAMTPYATSSWIFAILAALVLLLSGTTLTHFAERQKAIQFAKRKLVVLRAMLGLDYGRLQLVLPNWRLEGASQPFAILLFPGWFTYAAYPFWVIGSFTGVVLLVLTAHFIGQSFDAGLPSGVFAGIWVGSLAFAYRRALYDTHEGVTLSVAKVVAKGLNVRLASEMEYTLYRARLSVFELDRLGINTEVVEQLAVFVEDRGFLKHSGLSVRGMARAIRDYANRGRMSGGSTITQQLARTLFVVDYHKTMRRKLVESILALWLNGAMTKRDTLRMYLAAVRFEHGVTGLASAARYFFGHVSLSLSKAQSFVLIERIANVRSRLLSGRIDELLRDAERSGVLSTADACEAIDLYARLVESGKITCNDSAALARLRAKRGDAWGHDEAHERPCDAR